MYATGVDGAVEVVVEYAQKAALVQVSIGLWGDLSGSSSYSVEIFRDNGKGGFVSLGKLSQTHS